MTFLIRTKFEWEKTIPNPIRNQRSLESGVYVLLFEAKSLRAAKGMKDAKVDELKAMARRGREHDCVYSDLTMSSLLLARVFVKEGDPQA